MWAKANYIRVVGLFDSTIMDATQEKKKIMKKMRSEKPEVIIYNW